LTGGTNLLQRVAQSTTGVFDGCLPGGKAGDFDLVVWVIGEVEHVADDDGV